MMTTTSRGISRRAKAHRGSQTPGKDKGESCQKSPLKEWGRRVNPYKLGVRGLKIYKTYCDLTDTLCRTK